MNYIKKISVIFLAVKVYTKEALWWTNELTTSFGNECECFRRDLSTSW